MSNQVQWWFDNATVAESIELDLSKFESTATQDETPIYDTTVSFSPLAYVTTRIYWLVE